MNMIGFRYWLLLFFVAVIFTFVERTGSDSQKKIRIEKNIILSASYIFIIYADYRFAIVMVAVTTSTWFFAKNESLSWIGIVVPIAALSVFKYANFAVKSFCKVFGNDYTALNIIIPMGISFYTFSAVSYVVDIKRKKLAPQTWLDVAVYLSFFPKLTSGPIQRGKDFFHQLNCEKKINAKSVSEGIQIFVFGLFKKIVLADHLSVFVNQVYSTPKAFGSFTVLMAVFAYSLQIYFDFSGYSDIAIGSARIIGFNLPQNFNLPYLSQNVTEFWKRWHITLSSWLQDYLYISLGGNRKGKLRAYLNLLATMVIGGLWHGANWTYIIWGALHGIALIVHKVWMKITHSDIRPSGILGRIISTAITFIFVSFSWVFFRADSVEHANEIISRIFQFEAGLEQPYLWFFFAVIVLMAGSIAAYKKSSQGACSFKKMNICKINYYYPVQDLCTVKGLVFLFTFIGITLCLAYTGGSPFIYGAY